MLESLEKVQKISKKIDNLLLRGLGFMLIIIFIAGITSLNRATDINVNKATDNINEGTNTVNYRNCLKSQQLKYIPPKENLTTDIENSLIDLVSETDNTELGKAGLASLKNPQSISLADAVECISPKDEVFIVIYDDLIKIYPKALLNQHQIINDTFNETNLLITYSPLSLTTTAFLRGTDEFDISGRVYNGNTLMFDRKTESLWLQLSGKAVIGKRTGEALNKIVMQNSTFENATTSFPNAQLVSFDTGYDYDYTKDPYLNFISTSLPFGEINTSAYEIPPKDIGISFVVDENPIYYSISEIPELKFNDKSFEIIENPQLKTYEAFRLIDDKKIIIPFTYIYYYSFKEIYSNKNLY
ncbi:DUF3179 domain-containing protein [Candidatus Dojkabacteria bacterium]|nr:DUF3179 domain-containing protein [Candidatus Dojkabacteria bacterium]